MVGLKKKCLFSFGNDDESVEPLFISCPFVRHIWRLLNFTFNISPPSNIANLFGNWLNGVDKKNEKAHICICMLAFL